MTAIRVYIVTSMLWFAITQTQNTTTWKSTIPPGIFYTRSQYRHLNVTTTTESTPLPRPNTWPEDNIEYRLTRLEVQVGEKTEIIRSELREINRHLQALEWQNAESHRALESFRDELRRFAYETPQVPYTPMYQGEIKLEERVDNLSKGVKLLVATVRALNSDVATIRNNISSVTNKTRALFDLNEHLLTKEIFNNGILELRSAQPYHACHSEVTSQKELPNTCRDVQKNFKESGVYRIRPEHSAKPFMVYCDFETQGGGWTVIQNRYEGVQDFFKSWHDYKHGFGNLGGEFWIGLENIYQLTGHEVNELLVELEDFNRQKSYAHYGAFSVGPEVEGYRLKVLGGYNGDAGDSLIYHAGNRFSTKDMDQDAWPEGSCAQAHGGGWWYHGCDTSNLNGRYLNGALPEQYIYQGMYWGEFRGAQYSLLKARMLVRARDRASPPMFADNAKNDTSQDY